MKGLLYLIKLPLLPFSWIYGIVLSIRNKLYNNNTLKVTAFPKAIIGIGNLSMGGTGKTPHVEYLIKVLQDKFPTATLSRGFKRKTTGFILADKSANASSIGDEPMQYFFKYSKVKVAVCEDRVEGVKNIIQASPTIKSIILDDAFQHRAIKPGLNILISDYNNPFYKDYVVPFGRLREFRSGYKRADIIIVSKCPSKMSPLDQEKIISEIYPMPHQKVYFTTMEYYPIYDFLGLDFEADIRNKNILLITGIVNNSGILTYLKKFGCNIKTLSYPDHHYFSPTEIDYIKEIYDKWKVDNKIILTTEKDIVRLALHISMIQNWNLPIYTLPIEVKFLKDQALFDEQIIQFLQQYKKPSYER